MDLGQRQLGIVVAVIAIAVVGGALVGGTIGGGDDTDAGQNGTNVTTTVVLPAATQLQPGMWAIETGRVDVPDDITFTQVNSGSQLFAMIVSGEADAGIMPYSKLGVLSQKNPDFRLNGYGNYPGQTAKALYVRPESNITSISDLAGKRIAAKMDAHGPQLAMILERENVSNVTYIDNPQTKTLLMSGDVDAALIKGEQPDLRRLVYPRQWWEENIGGRVVSALWFYTGEQQLENSREAVQVWEEAKRVGYNNLGTVADQYASETGQNVTEVYQAYAGVEVIELTEQDRSTLQNVLDYMYENGYMQTQVDLSTLMAGS